MKCFITVHCRRPYTCNKCCNLFYFIAHETTPRPRLRSTNSQLYERQRIRLKFVERSFSCAGSRAWNSLSTSLHELTDTSTFKRYLKTFLF